MDCVLMSSQARGVAMDFDFGDNMYKKESISSISRSCFVLALALPAFSVHAAYPEKPISVVVPFAAGGPTDVLTRLVVERMARELGQPMVVENYPGAGGTLGNARVAKTKPDGYTILAGNVGTLAASNSFYRKLPYDITKDFVAISSIGDAPQVVSARIDFPATGLDALYDYVKPAPEKATFGAAGVGSGSYLGGVLLNNAMGLNVQAINYRGAGQALTDVIAKHVDYMVDSTTTSVGYIKSGKVKGVAVLRPQRIKALPDVPAAGESTRFKQLNYDIWNMLVVPSGTPAAVLERLNQAARKALHDPDVLARMESSGIETPSQDHQSVKGATHLLHSEIERWRPLIKQLNVQLD
jgi:tripartite-type tricarboxylate transporter receptor subunit TctC